MSAPSSAPEFDAKKVVVVFVLGGPGSGKGTQCASLVRDYGFVHLSARPGSQFGAMIAEHIKDGKIVPMEVTISLLRNAIQEALEKHENSTNEGWGHGYGRFLIDGFPRKLDQLFKFEETCSEEVMLKRLLQRGETSGRTDDNIESIKKRFRTFEDTSMPVVDCLRKRGTVAEVNSMNPVEQVYKDICEAMDAKFHQIRHM
ncbi:UMP/CMP kinase [Malassezia obtusa]|uniref:UMP/CMP kinase n=1 Tax=Malassezia obtusa TaxID=76774 RepID=A0AAF0IUK6_9BASI|nr:UMP/CMP kinase [Malassezia obtusa]